MKKEQHQLLNEQIELMQDLGQSDLDRYQSLLEFGKVINTSTNYNNIQRIVADKIKKILKCEYVILYKVDGENKELFIDYACSNQVNKDYRIKIDNETLPGSCAHFMATLNILDASQDDRYHRGRFRQRNKNEARNLLLTPMVSNGEILGVIKAVNKKKGAFNQGDIQMMEGIANQMTIAVHNHILVEELKKQFYQVCEAFADAIGKNDRYTGGHTKRVGHFAMMIAKEMNLSVQEIDDLRLAAVLHDVGKIGIEDKVLKKKAPLTKEEFEIMKEHPRLGYEILGHIHSLGPVLDGMRFHHEKPDGTGYPYGLKGEEIPLIARIISVADTFDAMVSTRPYRKGLPPMVAYKEIRDHSGSQFCEIVTEAFTRAFKKTKMYKPDQDDQAEEKDQLKKAS